MIRRVLLPTIRVLGALPETLSQPPATEIREGEDE